MAGNKGTVTKIGTRVDNFADNIRVYDVHQADLATEGANAEALQSDPTTFVRELLEENGYTVNRIEAPQGILQDQGTIPSPYLRTIWAHIVYDGGNPGNVSVWILVSV